MSANKQTADEAAPAKKDVFVYPNPFPKGHDDTKYRLVAGPKGFVKKAKFAGKSMLVVDPKALTVLAHEAMRDVSFLLRPEAPAAGRVHPPGSRRLPERPVHGDDAPPQRRRLGEVRAAVLPGHGHGHRRRVEGPAGLTGADDAEKISKGIWQTYTARTSATRRRPRSTCTTRSTRGTTFPAQIDIYATKGDAYKFLFVAKGGGSANKTYLFQETKALLNPASLEAFLVEKMKSPRHGRLPAVPHRLRRRRDVGRRVPQDRQARLDGLLRRPPDVRGQVRPRVPRPGAREEAPRKGAGPRLRRAVRRQVLRARRARHPPPAPRRVLPRRDGRLVLGRPQRLREDRREGALARGARAPPRDAPPVAHRREGARGHRQST